MRLVFYSMSCRFSAIRNAFTSPMPGSISRWFAISASTNWQTAFRGRTYSIAWGAGSRFNLFNGWTNPRGKYYPAADNRNFPDDLQDGSMHSPSLPRSPNCTADSLHDHSLKTCPRQYERPNWQFDHSSSPVVTFSSHSTDTILSRTKERETCENESHSVCRSCCTTLDKALK